jgi:hypothetical protein
MKKTKPRIYREPATNGTAAASIARHRDEFTKLWNEARPLQARTREIALKQMRIAFDVAQAEITAAFPGVPVHNYREIAIVTPEELNNAAKAIAAIRASDEPGAEPRIILVDHVRLRVIIGH